MNLAEKYRPKKIKDFIGDQEKFLEILEYVKSNFPVLVCGPPGIGKTSIAYAIANELGLSVSETNMSDERTSRDLTRILYSVKSTPLIPTLYLFDEVDGVSTMGHIQKIVNESKNPVLFTANEKMRISSQVKRQCKFIELKPPMLREVADLIKKIGKAEGLKPNYNRISNDVRSSINSAFHNAHNYEADPNDFQLTTEAFKENSVSEVDPVWLLDNVHDFYHGLDVYDTIKKIQYIIETGDSIYISTFKTARSGKVKYPNFARRR